MQLLLYAEADVNASDAGGETPLDAAVRYRNNPLVQRWLLDAGADINAEDADGNTPCVLAMNRRERDGLIDPSILSHVCPQ